MTSGFIQKLKIGHVKTEDEEKMTAIWGQDFLKVGKACSGLIWLLADGNALPFLANYFSRPSEQMHAGAEVMMQF